MPEPRTEPRPTQVTVLSGFAIVTSLLLTIGAYDSLGQVESVDMRHQVETYLGTGGGTGLTMSVDQALEMLRIMTIIGGGLAAAAFVMAIYVLLGHNGARVGLTVSSMLLLLDALALAEMGVVGEGGILPLALATVALMLWSPRFRQWFGAASDSTRTVMGMSDPNVTPPSEGAVPPEMPPAEQAAPAPPPPPAASPYGQAPPPYATAYPPPGQQPGQPSGPPSVGPAGGQAPPPQQGMPPRSYPYPQPGATPPYPPPPGYYGAGGYPPPQPGGRPGRPGSVVVAAVLTWVSAGLVLVGGVIFLLESLAARADLIARLEARPELQSYSASAIVTAMQWSVALIIVLSLAALVWAVFAFRGANWARVMLAVSAALAALISLLGIMAIFPLLTLAASVTTLVLLFRPSSNRYFASRGASQSFPVW